MTLLQNPPVMGVASVKIISAQPSDAGLYICEVTNPNDWSGSGQGLINLTVMGKLTNMTISTKQSFIVPYAHGLFCIFSTSIHASLQTPRKHLHRE